MRLPGRLGLSAVIAVMGTALVGSGPPTLAAVVTDPASLVNTLIMTT